MANVSVIIPSFNGISLLKKHLPSVLSALRPGDELIIIDDCSQDETLPYLIEHLKLLPQSSEKHSHCLIEIYAASHSARIQVVVRHHSQNLRFAHSCNLAVNSSVHDFIFLLNNDVEIEKNTLQNLTQTYLALDQQGKKPFAIGCLEHEGPDNKAVKAGKNVLFFQKGMFYHQKANNFESGPTAWVSGGSGLFYKPIWQKLRGFDLNFYPAYWEDVDLSFRARKMGYGIYFDESARVYHLHESTHQKIFTHDYITNISLKNQRYFTIKNGSVWQKLAYVLWRPYWLIFNIYHHSRQADQST